MESSTNKTQRLEKIAQTVGSEAKKGRHIFRSRNLTTLWVAAALGITMAAPKTQQDEKIHPLLHPALEPLASMSGTESENAIKSPATESWDESFVNIALWENLPKGNWRIESKTDTTIKYISEKTQDFLGGPARIVRIRTESKTGKIEKIEVLWAEIGLSVAMATTNFRDASGRVSRKIQKEAEQEQSAHQKEGTDYMAAVMAANKYISRDLRKRFGNPKSAWIGKAPEISTKAEEFTTPTGTTIRFLSEEKSMCMAIIVPTNVAEEQSRKVAIYDKDSINMGRAEWAAKNVERHPNGDLIIRNIPMSEQGPRGYCAGTASSMILEYWGSPIPLEILASRYMSVVWLGNAVKTVNYHEMVEAAATETRVKAKQTENYKKIRFETISEELEAGRPIYFARFVSPERTALHQKWRDEVAKNPDFRIPEESTDGKKMWPKKFNSSHSSIISGYNKERKEIMLTESWGEAHRNYRMSWAEFEATSIYIRTFHPR